MIEDYTQHAPENCQSCQAQTIKFLLTLERALPLD